ncbi:helix-turn-helix transcriptional regulator [Plantactinospora sp. KBS50]|uniref:helix-turn-helix domain-containing protein n=1 Tax=Plantactinospora sp. KBS50 TaxID=2024580 RepID=UPI000BAB0FF5|nr:helix-turn-helix transcriptional regulator [Plantactinospora sp. KBS50]ASW53691.1 DNA-binding protein [Plantactinospora sp. KBS50]
MAHPPMLELFAGELCRARTAAGLSRAELGELVGCPEVLLAKIEQAIRVPGAEFAQRCDKVLATDGLLTRIRTGLGREVLPPWLRDWSDIEREAVALRSYQPLVVPGLLQTEGYARALLAAGALRGDELEQQLAGRLERQVVLDREPPPRLDAVLDESVLHRLVGGRGVLREQLLRVLALGRRRSVHLHVVPAGAGAYPGLHGAFVLATAADGTDMGYLDGQLAGRVVERPSDVAALRQTWEEVRAEALPHRQSVELIERLTRG